MTEPKQYVIRTVQDITDRLHDPATQDGFREDFIAWMDACCAHALAMRSLQDDVEHKTGERPGVATEQPEFVWIDDGKRTMDMSIQVEIVTPPRKKSWWCP